MMNFHSHRRTKLSVPEWMWIIIGIRLIMKEVFTVFVMMVGVFLRLFDSMGKMSGVERVVSVSSIRVIRISGESITFTWICTKMSGS